MTYKEKATSLLQHNDVIQIEIDKLKAVQQNNLLHIKNLKQSLEHENSYLIGKKALCSNNDDPTFVDKVCECIEVYCNDDFNIIPRFSHNTKKIQVDNYKWI